MRIEKPKKRVILYWLIDYGFYFLIVSLFTTATFLKFSTEYYTLALYFFELTILILLLSLAYLVYKWLVTEYILLNKHLIIKEETGAEIIPYKKIKKIGYYGSVLQHLMGTTNLRIKTERGKYYLRGIRDYKKLEQEIFKKKMKS